MFGWAVFPFFSSFFPPSFLLFFFTPASSHHYRVCSPSECLIRKEERITSTCYIVLEAFYTYQGCDRLWCGLCFPPHLPAAGLVFLSDANHARRNLDAWDELMMSSVGTSYLVWVWTPKVPIMF